MVTLQDIRELQIEISSLCNARCPMCLRNYHGFPYNFGYEELNLTLDKIKQIVPESVVAQLDCVLINGNLGDLVMNPETPDILAWFRQHGRAGQKPLDITAFTNGGAQGREFWQKLAAIDVEIQFCIDGLEDTHHLYRQNTLYETVIRNAEYFIAAGGRAHWCMTEFEHNRHQIDEARRRSEQLGFGKFKLRNHGRDSGPVYDQHGQKLFELKKNTGQGFPEKITVEWIHKFGQRRLAPSVQEEVRCKALHDWGPISMYIAADGTIDPCCFIGNFSKSTATYVNDVHQLQGSTEINTLEKGIAWFNRIIDTFDTGKQLTACNTYCSKKSWYP